MQKKPLLGKRKVKVKSSSNKSSTIVLACFKIGRKWRLIFVMLFFQSLMTMKYLQGFKKMETSHGMFCNNINKNEIHWSVLCSENFIDVIGTLVKGGNDVHLINIGAHVGFEENDPFSKGFSKYLTWLKTIQFTERYKIHWHFVEPSPPSYQKLLQNIENNSHLCDMNAINFAIVSDSYHSKEIEFYRMNETIDPISGYDSRSGEKFPYWITQISSSSKESLEEYRHEFNDRGLNMDDYIIKTNVTVKSYSELMEGIIKKETDKLLFVLIDTEGFDCDMILGISESSPYLPYYFMFEDTHCGLYKKFEAFEYLKKKLGFHLQKTTLMIENTIATNYRLLHQSGIL